MESDHELITQRLYSVTEVVNQTFGFSAFPLDMKIPTESCNLLLHYGHKLVTGSSIVGAIWPPKEKQSGKCVRQHMSPFELRLQILLSHMRLLLSPSGAGTLYWLA